MIRLIGRRLIIPRGDSGDFTIPILSSVQDTNSVAVFSILDLKNNKLIYQKEIEITGEKLVFNFSHEETKGLPLGQYVWDIKAYVNPEYKNNKLINGDEVHSYYAGFSYPVCEITLSRDRR